MAEIEVDYLVVGAGASGMAFVDALVAEDADAEVLLVDRRHRPGGHWLDAYPFVRLHQPSATYGVNSRSLGDERIDESGPNAGFYERATAAEIVAYYDKVLEEVLLPSGRVRFLGMVEHRGATAAGITFVSLLTGEETTVRVRRRFVDATYTESSIPSRHTPEFTVDDGAVVVPPNDLVDLEVPASGYTVIGGGKTAMDTCGWLLDVGVDPDRIRWVRSRDGWYFNRAFTQPLEQVGSFMQLQAQVGRRRGRGGGRPGLRPPARGRRRLPPDRPDVEPQAFRGATLSTTEVEALRSIEDVVRRRARPPRRRRPDHLRRRRAADRPRPRVRRLHRRRGAADDAATGVRAGAHHAPVRHARVRAVGRRDDRSGGGDEGRRRRRRTGSARRSIFSGHVADILRLRQRRHAGRRRPRRRSRHRRMDRGLPPQPCPQRRRPPRRPARHRRLHRRWATTSSLLSRTSSASPETAEVACARRATATGWTRICDSGRSRHDNALRPGPRCRDASDALAGAPRRRGRPGQHSTPSVSC